MQCSGVEWNGVDGVQCSGVEWNGIDGMQCSGVEWNGVDGMQCSGVEWNGIDGMQCSGVECPRKNVLFCFRTIRQFPLFESGSFFSFCEARSKMVSNKKACHTISCFEKSFLLWFLNVLCSF